MFPFFNFLSFVTESLFWHSGKIRASNGKNPKRKPAVLDVDPVTVLWIIGAVLLVPLILTGFISQ